MKSESQPNSKQFWSDHVNHWHTTSVSQASYCQEHELSIKRFGYWKRKLLGATQLTTLEKIPLVLFKLPPRRYLH